MPRSSVDDPVNSLEREKGENENEIQRQGCDGPPTPVPLALSKKTNALGHAPPFQLLDRLHQQLPGEALQL